MAERPKIAVSPPGVRPFLEAAVSDGGGEVVPVSDAAGLVWASPGDGAALRRTLDDHRGISWVQLPWAGVEPFLDVFDEGHTWTSGKGVYAEPVAEHVLAMALAGFRNLHGYARADSWSGPQGQNLLGANVVILGGGAITESLLRLLGPFGTPTTVVRKNPSAIAGADQVVGTPELPEVLPAADLVVLALALTPETRHIIGAAELALMKPTAWLVNVARGGHVDHDALASALSAGALGGAALDVTDPEPLPGSHRLWSEPNCIITPHVGNTPEMAVPLLAARVRENVRRFGAGETLLGPVDVTLGY